MKKILLFAIALLCIAIMAEGKVSLPQLFQSGMVVQRGQPVPVWGMADAGESVEVEFRNKLYAATADAAGRWRIDLPKQKAGGPYKIVVVGRDADGGETSRISIDDVLVGDVWLCSGQSNIDVTVERVYPQYGSVIDDYRNENIRLFRVQTDFDTHSPKTDIKPTPINWKPVTKENAWLFSAVGYFLGREMYDRTGVPQGIIVNSLGGSPIQAWLAADTIRRHFPELYQQTVFFQDDDMVRAIQLGNALAQSRWQKMLDDSDQGLAEGFAARDYDDSGWTPTLVFMQNGDGSHRSVNLSADQCYTGSYWVRQHISIDAAHAGQPARLLVGTLYDADQTYVNGCLVGSTGYQYPPRRYTIPAGVLVEGDNVVTVRFITKGGAPRFVPEKPYKVVFESQEEVPLSDTWLVHEGAVMPECPLANTGGQNLPSVLYNAMLYPLAPYALSGVVWYQGESNTGDDSCNYERWLTQLVGGWRQLWQLPNLPFVVVQLANYMSPSSSPQNTGWTTVREAQRRVSQRLPNVGLAVTIDLGETVDIHPLRKREVAQRVALGFDKLLWNPAAQLYPEVVRAKTNGNVVELTLNQGIKEEASLYEFELAGSDGCFVNAEACGSGSTITVRSSVERPERLRYAWKNNPLKANVFNLHGLPMAPMEIELE
ncbi:MAG: sialate O-acetylesterase [Bacteroidaceae bacterium]|nr:sialate O-acetylesterase [Bacteroidaceae bacterium]